MSYSPLVNTYIPAYKGNYTVGRSGKEISEITIHHMAAVWSAQRCGESFQKVGREGSSNYGIGVDGEIACYVDEENTSWANSNWDSNCRAVTIENANCSTGGDWYISDATLDSLCNLVADIAKRNNLLPLVPGKNLTWHSMYSATACPGNYLRSKMQNIADEANKRAYGMNYNIIPVDCYYYARIADRALPEVKNKEDYAGIFGQAIEAVALKTSFGEVSYCVHLKDENRWLPFVNGCSWSDENNGYAGVFGKPIDGIMIKHNSTTIHYQVHTNNKWLGEITQCNPNDADYGYAGIFGQPIDGIYVWADPIIYTTKEEELIDEQIINEPIEEVEVEEPKNNEPTVEEPAATENNEPIVEEPQNTEPITDEEPQNTEQTTDASTSDQNDSDAQQQDTNIITNQPAENKAEDESIIQIIIRLLKRLFDFLAK